VALGSGALTPLEMTRAFAAIATNTAKVDSYSVREITNGDRTVYRKSEPRLEPVDNPLIHSEMLDLLTSVVRNGTGAAARLDRPVGGKTGTSASSAAVSRPRSGTISSAPPNPSNRHRPRQSAPWAHHPLRQLLVLRALELRAALPWNVAAIRTVTAFAGRSGCSGFGFDFSHLLISS
jgi:hypothetical protein